RTTPYHALFTRNYDGNSSTCAWCCSANELLDATRDPPSPVDLRWMPAMGKRRLVPYVRFP
ncbi:hypothetical protein M413DRAFT_447203, partial [Hebeloma cylindrosporum]